MFLNIHIAQGKFGRTPPWVNVPQEFSPSPIGWEKVAGGRMRARPAGKMVARAYHIRGLLKKYVIFCYFMFFCVSLPHLQGLAFVTWILNNEGTKGRYFLPRNTPNTRKWEEKNLCKWCKSLWKPVKVCKITVLTPVSWSAFALVWHDRWLRVDCWWCPETRQAPGQRTCPAATAVACTVGGRGDWTSWSWLGCFIMARLLNCASKTCHIYIQSQPKRAKKLYFTCKFRRKITVNLGKNDDSSLFSVEWLKGLEQSKVSIY